MGRYTSQTSKLPLVSHVSLVKPPCLCRLRPVSGLSGAGDMPGRPSTSAVRPASDLDRPQTGAVRSRPVTGTAESRSLGAASRPMTGLSRPATGFQVSVAAEVSRGQQSSEDIGRFQ